MAYFLDVPEDYLWGVLGDYSRIIFLILRENVFCGYSLQASRWDTSYEYRTCCYGEVEKVSQNYCQILLLN